MAAINIYPELVKHRTNKQGFAPIIIRFDFMRKHIGTDNIGHKVPPKFWDDKTKRVKDSYANASLINILIENTINRHKNFILTRQVLKLPVTKEVIAQYINSNSAFNSFFEYAEHLLENKKLSDGKNYSDESIRRYRDEIKRISLYKSTLNFNNIDVTFLEKYKLWLQNDYKKKDGKPLDINSVWKALSFIRMVYNQAIKDEIILPDNNPFKKFVVGSYSEHFEKIKYLEKNQVDKIEQILLSEDLPELTLRVGWRFLAMCVTGCRISDAFKIDEAFFNDAGDLEFKPYKTHRHNNVATIPIVSEKQKRLINKTIAFPPPKVNSFRTFFNGHLKLIAVKAGIEINLTSHIGRHTMGSFLVDANVDKRAAMAMLGVKSEKVIETYLHLKQYKLKQEASKLKNVF